MKARAPHRPGRGAGGFLQAADGELEKSIDIPQVNTWSLIVIDTVKVTENKCEIAFTTDGTNGQWLCVDNVNIIKFGSLTDVKTRNTSELKVYPNPVRDIINLKNSGEFDRLKIYNIQGQLVLQKSLNQSQNIDVSFLTEGIYTLILEDSKLTYTQKIIKSL